MFIQRLENGMVNVEHRISAATQLQNLCGLSVVERHDVDNTILNGYHFEQMLLDKYGRDTRGHSRPYYNKWLDGKDIDINILLRDIEIYDKDYVRSALKTRAPEDFERQKVCFYHLLGRSDESVKDINTLLVKYGVKQSRVSCLGQLRRSVYAQNSLLDLACDKDVYLKNKDGSKNFLKKGELIGMNVDLRRKNW